MNNEKTTEEIILYSVGCPNCAMLEKIMDRNNISYTIVNDQEIMQSKGFLTIPMIEYNGTLYNYNQAKDLIKTWGLN